jgi:hypothetical protein
MTIPQCFNKVKSTCHEIFKLELEAAIGETRMKRIIIHDLKPKYWSFVAIVQGSHTQPSLVDFENLQIKKI